MPDEDIRRIHPIHARGHASALAGEGPDAPPPNLQNDVDGGPHGYRPSSGRLKLIGIAVAAVAIAVAIYGIVLRGTHEHQLAVWTDRQALPSVSVSHPITDAARRALTLPGDVQAYYEAPLYASVNGYLHMWYE